jgi:DNA primase
VEGNQLVVLCESESSVDALSSQGLIATTWAGGASKPQIGALERSLSNARVLFVPDNDAAGMRCLYKLERELSPRLLSWTVKIGLDGEDARDLLERLGPDFFFTI